MVDVRFAEVERRELVWKQGGFVVKLTASERWQYAIHIIIKRRGTIGPEVDGSVVSPLVKTQGI